MSEIIHARDLVRRHGTLTAVDGISFSVRAGECFGFLGPNGAGKTTIIRVISCTSPVTSGELIVGEMDVRREPRRIKAALGVVPQENNLDPDLSVRQHLRVYGRYFDLPSRWSRSASTSRWSCSSCPIARTTASQRVAWFIPVTHVVNVYRGLTSGDVRWSHLGDIAWMVVVTAIFYTVAVLSMRRRLVK